MVVLCIYKKQCVSIQIWDQLDNEDRELRYNKLQLLLNKSTVYTQYLIKRMERQKQEDLKRTERRAKKMAKKVGKMMGFVGVFGYPSHSGDLLQLAFVWCRTCVMLTIKYFQLFINYMANLFQI